MVRLTRKIRKLVFFHIFKFQKNIKEQAVKSINRPKSISLPRALENRKIIFDPTMILSSDLKDHTGKMFAIKGQKFNPLKFTNLKETLIFINGDDREQVEYALFFQGLKQIILTKGEPLNLNKQHKQIFYFDFEGGLTRRFGIQKLPSVVMQKGEVLEINEIAL